MIELSATHDIAKAMRVPVWNRAAGESTRLLIDELAEFMLLSAQVAGELHEERLALKLELHPKDYEWDTLEGWEMMRQGKTDSSREQAKRDSRPDLYEEINNLRFHIGLLTDEIDRLNRDAEKAVSRAYTILTGT